MRARFLVFSLILIAFAAVYALRPAPKEVNRTEAWLEDATPMVVDSYRAAPGPDGDKQTYRMPKSTYDWLQAYGIISRSFVSGDKSFDVCTIAGNSRNCFHDPQLCFPGQGWQILETKLITISTRTRGGIPFTMMKVRHQADQPVWALFTFKGPHSMVASQGDLYMQWSLTNFLTGDPQEGASYRFISMTPEMTLEETEQFAADYMDAVRMTSDGVL